MPDHLQKGLAGPVAARPGPASPAISKTQLSRPIVAHRCPASLLAVARLSDLGESVS
jgi:hypothetical protein